MRLTRALRDERGFMNLGPAVLGVVLMMIVVLAFGGLTHQVLKTSKITEENSSRSSIVKSRVEASTLRAAALPTAAGNSVTIDAEIGNGWTWAEDIAGGGKLLNLAAPKFGHTVAECEAIAATGTDDGSCVIAKEVVRADIGGVKLTEYTAGAPTAGDTVLTVVIPAGAPTVRYFIPTGSFTSATPRIDFTSSTGQSGSTPAWNRGALTTADMIGEIETAGIAQTLTFTIVGGTYSDAARTIFYRGAFS